MISSARDERTGAIALRRVVRLFRGSTARVCRVRVARDDDEDAGDEPPSSSDAIRCTPGHPFFVDRVGWIAASELRAGDRLLGARGERVVVRGVELRDERAETFNFEVEELHTYFVAASASAPAVWVHNTCVEQILKGLRKGENAYLNTAERFKLRSGASGNTVRLAPDDWKRIVRHHVRNQDPAINARNLAERSRLGRHVTTQFTGTEAQYMQRLMKAVDNRATLKALRDGRPYADVKFGGRSYRIELDASDGSVKGFYALEPGGEFVKVEH